MELPVAAQSVSAEANLVQQSSAVDSRSNVIEANDVSVQGIDVSLTDSLEKKEKFILIGFILGTDSSRWFRSSITATEQLIFTTIAIKLAVVPCRNKCCPTRSESVVHNIACSWRDSSTSIATSRHIGKLIGRQRFISVCIRM